MRRHTGPPRQGQGQHMFTDGPASCLHRAWLKHQFRLHAKGTTTKEQASASRPASPGSSPRQGVAGLRVTSARAPLQPTADPSHTQAAMWPTSTSHKRVVPLFVRRPALAGSGRKSRTSIRSDGALSVDGSVARSVILGSLSDPHRRCWLARKCLTPVLGCERPLTSPRKVHAAAPQPNATDEGAGFNLDFCVTHNGSDIDIGAQEAAPLLPEKNSHGSPQPECRSGDTTPESYVIFGGSSVHSLDHGSMCSSEFGAD